MAQASVPSRPNRRTLTRLKCGLTVRYLWGKGWHPATVVDLSTRGCRLRLGEELGRDGGVTLVFERPVRDGCPAASVEARGRVVWSRREGLSYQAGIHFPTDPPGLDEVLNQIG